MKPDLIEGDIEYIELYMKALEVAKECHKDQKDKGGHEYIGHPIRVSDRCASAGATIAGLLHDTIEDSDMTPEKLIELGFPVDIVDVVKFLTRKEGETYNNYIKRVGENKVAREVKIADLKDNLDITRLPYPITKDDLSLLNRYLKALKYLKTIDSSSDLLRRTYNR